jgi:arylsulfatase A-like enzyme
MSSRFIAAALLGALACNTLGCDGNRLPKATPLRPNVLFVAVDTLRADRLDCYGSTRELTPAIDRLAKSGARFEACFSHAPWTLPSFASMFTALDPRQHGAGGCYPDFRGLRDSVPTLPRVFRDAGYRTHAVVNVDFLSPSFGVTRGFEDCDSVYAENNEEKRGARKTTDAASRWIGDHRDESFFLLVHYFDPHAEYRPPAEFREKFAAEVDRKNDGFVFGTREQVSAVRLGRMPLDHENVQRAEKLYDGEVAFTDHEIGRLLDELERLGLRETTLVVFTADHGEEFLDHGSWEHGHTLYDELLHVPLILSQPNRIPARVIASPVGHIDLARTLCAHCLVPPAPSFGGRDVAPLLKGEEITPAPLLAFGNFWGAPLASFRDAEFELIVRPAGKTTPERRELYRWRDDPRELRDLEASSPDVVHRLGAELVRRDGELQRSGYGPGPRVDLSEQESQRLKGLGYTGGEEAK